MDRARLAIEGGTPVRTALLPYGRQIIEQDDIDAVAAVLRSDWLTTGPMVERLEQAFAEQAGVTEAVAVSNGTAALHAAVFAADIGPGDEVIVPSLTFAASANCVLYQGGTPVFADVSPGSLLLDPEAVRERLTPRTRAIITVDYAGQPCDYAALGGIARERGLALIADACHAVGGTHAGRPVGSLAEMSTFSLHPVKHITSGEGGVVTTDDARLAERMRAFRNHGISTDHRQRQLQGSFYYEMVDLGFNYRLTDLQCALGMSQLGKLTGWIERRRDIAARYGEAFSDLPAVVPLDCAEGVSHAHHLYVIKLRLEELRVDRGQVFDALRAEGIGVNVHYLPVHLHPYYRERLGLGEGLCPVAEEAYKRILTLPLFPAMEERDIADVIAAVEKVVRSYAA